MACSLFDIVLDLSLVTIELATRARATVLNMTSSSTYLSSQVSLCLFVSSALFLSETLWLDEITIDGNRSYLRVQLNGFASLMPAKLFR